LRDAPAVSVIEGQTLSWRFQLRGKIAPPANVVILAVDDRTVAKLGRWPIPHQELATAVRKLADSGAAVIGLDLLLLDREPPSNGFQLSPGDRALFEALRDSKRGVLAVAFTFAAEAVPSEPALKLAENAAFRVVRRASDAETHALRGTALLG